MRHKYDRELKFENILDQPGIWVEFEQDRNTFIYERTEARYVIPFSKDCVVDLNTGKSYTINELNIDNSDMRYYWMLVYAFNNNMI